MSKTYKDAFMETAGIAKAALDGLEDEMTNVAELMQKNDELERKVHQLKRMNNESLDLLAADTVRATAMQDKIEILEWQNAEMLAMLKEMADGGRYTEAEVRALIRKVEGK